MKKKLLIASLICFLIAGTALVCMADDGDIDQVEVKPDVAVWALDTIKILRFTETAITITCCDMCPTEEILRMANELWDIPFVLLSGNVPSRKYYATRHHQPVSSVDHEQGKVLVNAGRSYSTAKSNATKHAGKHRFR